MDDTANEGGSRDMVARRYVVPGNYAVSVTMYNIKIKGRAEEVFVPLCREVGYRKKDWREIH